MSAIHESEEPVLTSPRQPLPLPSSSLCPDLGLDFLSSASPTQPVQTRKGLEETPTSGWPL